MPADRPTPPASTVDAIAHEGNPKRIQRKRTKGWRLPAGAVCVDRSTIWGNPFPIGEAVEFHRLFGQPDSGETPHETAVRWYRDWLAGKPVDRTSEAVLDHRRRYILAHLDRLRGKTLACFCPEGAACHADVLIELVARDA